MKKISSLLFALFFCSSTLYAQDMRSWYITLQVPADGVIHETDYAHPVSGTMYIRGIQSHRYIGNLSPTLTVLPDGTAYPSTFWVCLKRAVNNMGEEIFDMQFQTTPGVPNTNPPITFNPPIILQPGDIFEIGFFGSGGGTIGGGKHILYTTTP